MRVRSSVRNKWGKALLLESWSSSVKQMEGEEHLLGRLPFTGRQKPNKLLYFSTEYVFWGYFLCFSNFMVSLSLLFDYFAEALVGHHKLVFLLSTLYFDFLHLVSYYMSPFLFWVEIQHFRYGVSKQDEAFNAELCELYSWWVFFIFNKSI